MKTAQLITLLTFFIALTLSACSKKSDDALLTQTQTTVASSHSASPTATAPIQSTIRPQWASSAD
ncbi:hypothetical protein [Spirosoma endbachense]|uniref:Uncharacterized protein n=1 Tax=Spirosoma endbachense TaxID=2666025 RepID=A0A6P1VXR4_9BACT|nr:hypothetical protein [Spirosoma endbachense]QHV96872.1 hypothetical protein GJR95_18475 [Spirosoma endbachense]